MNSGHYMDEHEVQHTLVRSKGERFVNSAQIIVGKIRLICYTTKDNVIKRGTKI